MNIFGIIEVANVLWAFQKLVRSSLESQTKLSRNTYCSQTTKLRFVVESSAENAQSPTY